MTTEQITLDDRWFYDQVFSTDLETKVAALTALNEATEVELSPWGAMDACCDSAGGCERLMTSGPDGYDWYVSIIWTDSFPRRNHFAAFVFYQSTFKRCTWGSLAAINDVLCEDAPERYIGFLRMAWETEGLDD